VILEGPFFSADQSAAVFEFFVRR